MPEPGPSWDVVADIQLLLQFHFMQNAFLAGTLVALLAGTAGYFVVLRGQSFAAHMLSQVGFPGAAAGVLVQYSCASWERSNSTTRPPVWADG